MTRTAISAAWEAWLLGARLRPPASPLDAAHLYAALSGGLAQRVLDAVATHTRWRPATVDAPGDGPRHARVRAAEAAMKTPERFEPIAAFAAFPTSSPSRCRTRPVAGWRKWRA